jgi:hypothetical protein
MTMAVEIRELVIRTSIVSRSGQERDAATAEKILVLKRQIVQECLRALKDKSVKNRFDR